VHFCWLVRTWIGDVQNILVELGAYFISKKKKNWEHTFKSRLELVFGYKKCSWLVVQALEHADEDQKKIVFVSTFNLANFQNKEDSA